MDVGGSTGRGRRLAGVLLAAVGLVWVGQGTGLLQGSSFMVGDPLWAVAGAVAVVAGIVLVALPRSSRGP